MSASSRRLKTARVALDSTAADTIAAGAPTFTIVTNLATGKVLRVETVLADGSLRVLYPLTPEQIDEFERELTAPRH